MHRRTLSSLSILLFLLAGCMTVQTTEHIGKKGDIALEYVIDLRPMMQTMQGLSQQMGGSGSIRRTSSASSLPSSFSCADMKTKPSNLADVRCTQSGAYVLILSGTAKATPSAFRVRHAGKQTVYLYQVRALLPLLSSADSPMTVTSLRTEERKNKGKPQLARYTVTIEMPAPVTRSDIGTLAGNRVTFDLYDIGRLPRAVIEARE